MLILPDEAVLGDSYLMGFTSPDPDQSCAGFERYDARNADLTMIILLIDELLQASPRGRPKPARIPFLGLICDRANKEVPPGAFRRR